MWKRGSMIIIASHFMHACKWSLFSFGFNKQTKKAYIEWIKLTTNIIRGEKETCKSSWCGP
jgi:hypothetical protein